MRTTFLTFMILLIAYAAFVVAVPPPPTGITSSQESLNRQVVERYRFRIDAPAVIVGSSLSARVAAPGNDRCLYDLSIAGGSALTGLDIVAQKPVRPRLVLVEINLLDRPVDSRFVEAPLPYRRYLPITWVENAPVNRLLSAISTLRPSASLPSPRPVLEQPLRVQQAAYSKKLSPAEMRQMTIELQRRLKALTDRGVRIVLFEMPLHPSLMDSVRARQIRDLVQQAFPRIPFLDGRQLDGGIPVVTTDGVHLQPFEARHVLERLAGLSGVGCLKATEKQGERR